jgi:hypothetical protein
MRLGSANDGISLLLTAQCDQELVVSHADAWRAARRAMRSGERSYGRPLDRKLKKLQA